MNNPFEVNPFELSVDEQLDLINKVDEENKLATQILEIESQVANYKELQKELEMKADNFKTELRKLMISRGVKSWKTPNNFTFTVVEEKAPERILEKNFDEKTFKEELPELYEKYLKEEEKIKNGRKGYLKITTPKEVK